MTVVRARAEALAGQATDRGRWPIVTCRAVGSTADLVELAFPLLSVGGSLIAWKRGDLDDELATARRAIDGLGGGTLEVSDVTLPELAGHKLVVATPTGAVPARFPRDPSLRRRRPW